MINTSESRIIFNGNGTATEFPYSFAIINDTDVKVMTVDPDGMETVLDSDYYVDVTASKVIYPGYPPGEEPAESERPPVLPTGWQLVVYRDIPITQEANLGNVWPFNVIEDALDKITMILQNIYDGFKRSFKVSQSAPAYIDIYVPIEANKALKWNADGTQIVLTTDPAEVLPIAENLLQQTTQQANIATEQAGIATNKANAAAESAVSAATSETNAANSEDKAQAWAESEISPDGEDDADSPTGDTMSSKEWALYAKEIAENMGNPVTDVDEENGTVTVTKSDGTQSSFKAGINILQRNKTYAVEDIAYSFGLPSWAYLECTEAGTTAATEPSFASATTPGTYVTDGTAEFILCDMRDGTPVGRVVYAETLQDGYLKYNGATVSRSDYKRPCRYATKKNLFYDADDTYTFMGTTAADSTTITGISAADIEKLQTAKQVCGDGILITGTGIADDCMIDTINEDSVTITVAATAAGTVKISYGNIHNYPYMYGIGDGTSTFVLPDYRGRFIMGGDNVQGLPAGLPNITGKVGNGSSGVSNNVQPATGAFLPTQKLRSGGYSGTANMLNILPEFDASKSNSIYGKATTVQPPSFSLLPQIKY